jgi:S1-C subfamily serine protease
MRLPRIQDPELLNKVRQGSFRAEALHGERNPELSGVVLDDQGHVLLMMTLLRDDSDVPIKVTTADGREFGATFVGADYLRGFSILKMTGGSALPPPVDQARSRPQAGELLLCLSANTGAAGWITAPGVNMAPRRGDERFAVFGEDRGPVFLFAVDGKISAVGLDHYALPIAAMKKEIQEVTTKGFVSRRQFGVRHTVIGMDSPLRKIPALSHKPAIRVEEVFKNSLAERAGLKKDDIILTIDERPITQLPRILQDLYSRSGEAKIGVIRCEKEMELTLPLDKPAEEPGKRD